MVRAAKEASNAMTIVEVLELALNVRGIIIIDAHASTRIFVVVCATRELVICPRRVLLKIE